MTDEQIIELLKSGETLNFRCNGRNSEVMALMADLEEKSLVRTEDMSLSQETRRIAVWIGDKEGEGK